MNFQNKKFHFISGLPRSGSTLLSAILRQNPQFEAGMTSPLGTLTAGLRTLMSNNIELDPVIGEKTRVDLLKAMFTAYYQDTDSEVIFDTNRSWTARIPELKMMFDDVKVVAMVRSPAWIIDSIERIARKDPMRQSALVRPGANINARTEVYMSNEGIVGSALGMLNECLYGEASENLMVVEYDALCANPDHVMDAIYTFLGEETYNHDFSSVEYAQDAFDEALKTPGLHTVQGAVRQIERRTILPPEIFSRHSGNEFWREDIRTDAVRVLYQ